MSSDAATLERETVYRVGTLFYTKRTLAKLFFWLLWGDVCFVIMESVVPSILPLQFQKLGASNTTVGLIMATIPSAMTAVLNPIISFRSDRYRSRLGRRIPFILLTLPFLVLSLFGIGFSDHVGAWIGAHFGVRFALSPQAAIIWATGVLMVAFTFFNIFVQSVFWYLFNDVVPESLLARFMSLFRLVSLAAASVYNLFIFQYAGAHSREILVCAGLLYFFGFGAMCMMVKEGEYPPPPAYVDGRTNIVSALKTFFQECMTLRHYWLIFLATMWMSLAGSVNIFMIYFYESTGMNLAQIGRITGTITIASALLIPISGFLADRFNPVRVVIAGYIVSIGLALPATLLWLFSHPSPHLSFVLWMTISIALTAPTVALLGVFDPPLFMVMFPRSRYGQFCSANAMLRALAAICGGVLAGEFFDFVKRSAGPVAVYHFLPVWQIAFSIPAMVCVVLLYRSWKRYGGDGGYVPPVPGESVDQVLHEELAEDKVTVSALA